MEFFTELGVHFLSELLVKSIEYTLRKTDKSTFESLQNIVPLLCAKAYDIDDAVKKAELFGRKKRKREVQEWLEQVQAVEGEFRAVLNEMQTEGFVRRFFVGGDASKLDARVHVLVEQAKDFGELVVDDGNVKGEEFLTKWLVGKEFDKNLKKIWDFLVIEKVSSIGIYGMGGTGKTTLAKHFNNQLIKQSQEHVVWITVSQEFSVRMLQDKMAKELGLELSVEYDEDKSAIRLNRALSKKKNLVLIVDDVWNEFDLVKLGDPLSIDRCRLLITTRSETVCHRLHSKHPIKVEKLVKDEAWELFEETLGQTTILMDEMQNIAESMVDECNGLPLSIFTLAASMRGESSINVWRDALEKLREQDLEENVLKVLKHGFDWLGQCEGKSDEYSESQQCFLYCSLYPEDYRIAREELIRKCILEGFLSKRRSRKAMFVRGHAILDKLVNACLLERSMTYGRGDCVKMHDLMRDMAIKITKGVHYQCLFDETLIEEELSKDIKRLYLSMGMEEIPSEMSLNFPKLVTLLLSDLYLEDLELIPDSFFLHMCSLCILDLSGIEIKKLSDSLSGLVNLKGLLLRLCSNLEYMPYLGNLKKLRELDLEQTQIQELPQGVEELSDLRFLSLYVRWKLKMFPKHLLPKFPYLQCLLLPDHIEVLIEEIEKLKHLEEVRGKVKDASEFNRLISGRHNLSYSITVGSTSYYGHEGYNQFTLSEYDLEDVVVLAKDIQHLNLDGCKGLSNCLVESLPQLNINPTSIKTLYIQNCEEIECIWRIDRGGITSASTSTSGSPPLPPPPPPPASFSSLNILHINRCGNMMKLGLPVSHLINLSQLWIGNCKMIEEIVEFSEEDIGGQASMPLLSLPKLERLSLQNLPRLKSMCNAKLVCNSIWGITLQGYDAKH